MCGFLGDDSAERVIRILMSPKKRVMRVGLIGAQLKWAHRCFGSGRHCFVDFASVPPDMLTVSGPLQVDNPVVRMGARLDNAVAASPLGSLKRTAVLVLNNVV